MTPVEFQKKILKNPWFLWALVLLGINPLYLVGPTLSKSAEHLESVSQEAALANFGVR